MKHLSPLAAGLCALLLLASPCPAQGDKQQFCEVSIGALSLPGNSDGLMHWIGSKTSSQELQLSTRYFSGRIEPESGLLRLYDSPTTLVEGEPIPEPLLTVRVPPGSGLIYVVVWTDTGDDGKPIWRSRTLNAKDWKRGTMKLINASPDKLGLAVGTKKFTLAGGKSYDFTSREWPEPFPAKIFVAEPEVKNIFSSKWRVTAASRELCFIAKVNGRISIRSLIDLSEPEPPES